MFAYLSLIVRSPTKHLLIIGDGAAMRLQSMHESQKFKQQ
jgi:hypothetical protein